MSSNIFNQLQVQEHKLNYLEQLLEGVQAKIETTYIA
jgi:hypothetical protein